LPALRHWSAVQLLHCCPFCSIPAGSPTNRGAGLLRSSRLLRPGIGVEPAAAWLAQICLKTRFTILGHFEWEYSESL
jgi:hypothetical protein